MYQIFLLSKHFLNICLLCYRLKENFGWSIAGTTKEDQLRWMAALLLAEYGVEGIAPPITVNNLLDY